MVSLIEPKTDRLHLRQWQFSDREPFAAMSANPQVMAFFPSILDRPASDGIVDTCQNLISLRGWGIWAVEVLATAEFVGLVGLSIPGPNLPPSPCVEVLWRLAPQHWGHGYATEAASAALKVGFEQLHLQEIVSFVVPSNLRSRAVMARLNMVDSGSTFEHPELPVESHLREHCLYKLSRDEWLRSG